jgi:alpha-ketoglutarate-dependent taurine dioxygenase
MPGFGRFPAEIRKSAVQLYNTRAFHNIPAQRGFSARNAPKAGAAMKLTANQNSLGVRIDGIDLSKPVSQPQFATILAALGKYGVICFPKQALDARALKAFSERFGSLQGSPTGDYCEPGVPEVMLLSNIRENGKPIGLADAGQDWHTDMSYNEVVGFTNVLHGIKIPRRDGKPLGNTVFADMHAAYEDLSPAFKTKLANATATHDFNKFWEEMRNRPGSTRAPLTAAQRARLRCIRFSSRTRSLAARSSTPIQATRCASTNWTKRTATISWPSSPGTNFSRSTNTRTFGARATC